MLDQTKQSLPGATRFLVFVLVCAFSIGFLLWICWDNSQAAKTLENSNYDLQMELIQARKQHTADSIQITVLSRRLDEITVIHTKLLMQPQNKPTRDTMFARMMHVDINRIDTLFENDGRRVDK